MKVFLDTNVLVSGFATRGLSSDVVRLVLAEHELMTGEVVIEEVRRVLRDKFGVPEATATAIETLLRRHHVEPKPATVPVIEVRDPDDAWVLASALAASAEVLVTGDQDLLTVNEAVDELTIISPRGFWELIRQRS